MSVQVSYKKQFTLGIFLIVSLLVGIEMVVIISDLFKQPPLTEINEVFQDFDEQIVKDISSIENYAYRYDKILLNEPNQQFPTLNINSYGFRGPEITMEKSENLYLMYLNVLENQKWSTGKNIIFDFFFGSSIHIALVVILVYNF